MIMQKIRWMKPGQVVKIVNSFCPEPLILLLEKRGFDSWVNNISDDLVETYFYKKEDVTLPVVEPIANAQEGWEEALEKYKDRLQLIDVRSLPMPLPMLSILEALYKLPADRALFVYHKRIPVYLLPELRSKKFSYRIKEISNAEVNLLIYKA